MGFYFSDSKLTQLLREELGGNCKTRALLNIKPQSDPNTFNAIVQFTTKLSQVKNFPVINDSYAQVRQLYMYFIFLKWNEIFWVNILKANMNFTLYVKSASCFDFLMANIFWLVWINKKIKYVIESLFSACITVWTNFVLLCVTIVNVVGAYYPVQSQNHRSETAVWGRTCTNGTDQQPQRCQGNHPTAGGGKRKDRV